MSASSMPAFHGIANQWIQELRPLPARNVVGHLLCFATVFIVLFTTPASEFVTR